MARTWNATFEAEPAGGDQGSIIDNKIRETRSEIRKRMDTLVSNWATDPDTPTDLDLEDGVILSEHVNVAASFKVPEGSILAWLPGYFDDNANGTFTPVEITLSNHWKECDGSALNDSNSTIFDGAGRYLPKLTDDRFLMGDASGNAGDIGGNNAMAHTHAAGTLGACVHLLTSGDYFYTRQETLTNWTTILRTTIPTTSTIDNITTNKVCQVLGTTAAASNTENRPKYLACRYIMKVRA